jgi:hypothetical protein
MTKIGNRDPNVFAKNREALNNASDSLQQGAKEALKGATADLKSADAHTQMAIGHVVAAGVRAVESTGHVLKGTADAFEAAGHAAAAGGFAGLGALGWAAEGVSMAGRFVAKNVARGFAGLANVFTSVLKDGKTTTVRELAGDPNAVRFSDQMFGKASDQLNKSAAAMNAAWGSYVNAVDSAMMSGVHAAMATGHVVAVAGNLATAAGKVGAAGVLELADLGVQVAKYANNAAEAATVEARDAAILAAKISASVANKLAVAGQGEVKVDVSDELKAFQKEFAQLQAAN